MADKKISALTAASSAVAADFAHIITDTGTTPVNKKITIENLFSLANVETLVAADYAAVTVSTSTQALDGKRLFLCTGTGSALCVATMTAGDYIGQQITIVLVATAPTSFKVTPASMLDHSGGSNTKVNIPTVGSNASFLWSGSNWIITSLVGGAVTST
mgnify:CR=1 FL=1